jgi:hydrogenase/urease accessory protein HupE
LQPERERRPTAHAWRWQADCGDGALDIVYLDGIETSPTDVILRYTAGEEEVVTRILDRAENALMDPERSAGGATTTYIGVGFRHILSGFDHLLFLLALVLLVRGARPIIVTVTAFTIAHSITLALAALDLARPPNAPVEALIAASIVLVAIELAHPESKTLTHRCPWLIAFGFGLLHGFGFAGALTEMGLDASSLPPALLGFNLGVELGQLVFVALILGAVVLVTRRRDRPRAVVERLVAYGVGTVAVAWTLERIVRMIT